MGMNPRIIGAFVVGGVLLGGAYVFANADVAPEPAGSVAAVGGENALRESITVTDSNGDGLEDWHNTLTTVDPIRLSQAPAASSTAQGPETLTGEFSIRFFEQILRSQMYGEFGSNQEAVVQKTIAEAVQNSGDTLYDRRDLVIIPNSDNAIRAYGNRAANIIIENNIKDSENESMILKRSLDRQDEAVLEELVPRAHMYATLRDEYLNTPVPEKLVNAHLNTINSFHAIYKDIEAMRDVYEDPLYALIRIKRYQDDAMALRHSLGQIYTTLAQTPEVFEPNDSALLFITFAPNANRPTE